METVTFLVLCSACVCYWYRRASRRSMVQRGSHEMSFREAKRRANRIAPR